MNQALIIGASGGIGAALVAEFAKRDIAVTALSRSHDGIDVTDEASIQRSLSVLTGPYDWILVTTGGLEIGPHRPEKSLRALDPTALATHFALNATGPALVLKHALRLLARDRPARFAALSARVGSIGDNALGGWYSYRAAKAALNQLIHTAAIEVARSHPLAIVTTLHPGTVDTGLTRNYRGGHEAMPPSQAANHILNVLSALTPADTGGFFDWQGTKVPW